MVHSHVALLGDKYGNVVRNALLGDAYGNVIHVALLNA